MEPGWYGRPAGTVKREGAARGGVVSPSGTIYRQIRVIDRLVGRFGPPERSIVHGCAPMVPGGDVRSPVLHLCRRMVPEADGWGSCGGYLSATER